jgi:hypothetical protein
MHGGGRGLGGGLFLALKGFALFSLGLGCSAGRSPDPGEGDAVRKEEAATVTETRRWFEKQKLTGDDPLDIALFGAAVAATGDLAVIGAPQTHGPGLYDTLVGAAYAFERSQGVWRQTQKLAIEGAASESYFGAAVAISDDNLLVGEPGAGRAHAYRREGSRWVDPQTLVAGGAAVAIDGNLAVVGAKGSAAYVFERIDGVWTQRKKLEGTDHPWVDTADFGAAVAISGTTVVVGAPLWGFDPKSQQGKAYVFQPAGDLGGEWSETELVAFDGLSYMGYGWAVAVSGSTIAIGAPGLIQRAGVVYFYTMTSEMPWPVSRHSMDEILDSFGTAIAFSGNSVAIGAPNVRVGSNNGQGAAYVFSRDGADWALDERFSLSDQRGFESFGSSVAFWDDQIIAGAPYGPQGEINHGAAYFDALLEVEGNACTTGSDCGLGHCVSGTCCRTACEGACQSCATGQCRPVHAGGVVEACRAYLCDGVGGDCPSSCTVSTDCIETHYCRDGECVRKRDLGDSCASPDECASGRCGTGNRCVGSLANGAECSDPFRCRSGYCVDGVCCNEACRGQCEACNEEGTPGECTPVSGAPRGDRSACAGEGICAGECNVRSPKQCRYPASEQACGGTCVGARLTGRACDGAGACVEGATRDCEGGYSCADDTSCKASCRTDGDCVDGLTCAFDGSCGPSASCEDGGLVSVTARDGARQYCSPYRCDEGGSCKKSCVSADDCAPSNVCFEHRCGPPPDDEAGCGCRTMPATRGGGPAAVALLFFGLLRRRRRGAFFSRRYSDGR